MSAESVHGSVIVADARAAQAPATEQPATAAPRAAQTQATPPSKAGGVSLTVQPDFGKMTKLGTAQQQGNDLIAAVVIGLVVLAFLGGIAASLVGKLAGFPDWESRGKKAIILAPMAAFAVSMVGQVVGWGWTLGI